MAAIPNPIIIGECLRIPLRTIAIAAAKMPDPINMPIVGIALTPGIAAIDSLKNLRTQ